MKAIQVCPRCGSGEYIRERRRWYERMLWVVRAYKCQRCSKRFYSRSPRAAAPEAEG